MEPTLTLQDVGFGSNVDLNHPGARKAQRLIELYNSKASEIGLNDRYSIVDLLKQKPWEQATSKTISSHSLYRRMWKDRLPRWSNINYPNFFVLAGLYGDSASLENIRESINRLYDTTVSSLTLDWPGNIFPSRLEQLLKEETTLRGKIKTRKALVYRNQQVRKEAQEPREDCITVAGTAAASGTDEANAGDKGQEQKRNSLKNRPTAKEFRAKLRSLQRKQLRQQMHRKVVRASKHWGKKMLKWARSRRASQKKQRSE